MGQNKAPQNYLKCQKRVCTRRLILRLHPFLLLRARLRIAHYKLIVFIFYVKLAFYYLFVFIVCYISLLIHVYTCVVYMCMLYTLIASTLPSPAEPLIEKCTRKQEENSLMEAVWMHAVSVKSLSSQTYVSC